MKKRTVTLPVSYIFNYVYSVGNKKFSRFTISASATLANEV